MNLIIPWLLTSLVISILLDKFGNVKSRDRVGQKLGLGLLCYDENEFLRSCKNGYLALFETAIRTENKSIFNVKDDEGQTIIHQTIIHDRIEMVNHLLEQPLINLNVQNNSRSTPLHTGWYGVYRNEPSLIHCI